MLSFYNHKESARYLVSHTLSKLPTFAREEDITSVKLCTTYDHLKLNDGGLLDVMMITGGSGTIASGAR